MTVSFTALSDDPKDLHDEQVLLTFCNSCYLINTEACLHGASSHKRKRKIKRKMLGKLSQAVPVEI